MFRPSFPDSRSASLLLVKCSESVPRLALPLLVISLVTEIQSSRQMQKAIQSCLTSHRLQSSQTPTRLRLPKLHPFQQISSPSFFPWCCFVFPGSFSTALVWWTEQQNINYILVQPQRACELIQNRPRRWAKRQHCGTAGGNLCSSGIMNNVCIDSFLNSHGENLIHR